MIDKLTVERVRNWARWAHTPRGAKLSACMSIEHRYRPERLHEGELDDRRTPAPIVDVRDALLVWRAISPANGFPARWYLALSARFVLRLDGYEFTGYMRRHRVPVGRSADEHDGLIYEALSAARNAIYRADIATISRQRYNQSVPLAHGSGPLERLSASVSRRAV